MKRLLSVLAITVFFFSSLQAQKNTIEEITNALNKYSNTLRDEKVYIHLDKPAYTPGDEIWLKAYLLDGSKLTTSQQSQIVNIDLINPKGAVEKSLTLFTITGFVAGNVSLKTDLPGGLYKIRAYTNWMKNFGEHTFFEKEIFVQKPVLPKLLLKLEFERRAYGAGDKVYAFVTVTTLDNKPLKDKSFQFKVQLNGNEFKTDSSYTDENGKGEAVFLLPKDLKTDDGILTLIFTHDGFTESITRSIPIVLHKIDLRFFPEGGDLVEGITQKIAFKAVNNIGKGADIEGIVMNEKGKEITSFSSFHLGMGAFNFTAEKGQKYKVKITKPEGIDSIYFLPEAKPGLALSVISQNSNQVELKIYTPEIQILYLTAQVRGKIYYSKALQAQTGNNELIIPLDSFPTGIAQFTVFDAKKNPHAERLVFINSKKIVNINIYTDKEKYLPREKVIMKIKATDEKGMPVAGNFSLSVANDKLYSLIDDKQDNILTWLLVSSELKGKIEEPYFYFKKENTKSEEALDLVMLTHGWRRFTWKDILNKKPEELLSQLPYKAERKSVRGRVTFQPYNNYSYSGERYLKNIKVKVEDSDKFTITDDHGYFEFRDLDLSSKPAILKVKYRFFKSKIEIDRYSLSHRRNERETENYLGGRILIRGIRSTMVGSRSISQEILTQQTIVPQQGTWKGLWEENANKNVAEVVGIDVLDNIQGRIAGVDVVVIGYESVEKSDVSSCISTTTYIGPYYANDLNLDLYMNPPSISIIQDDVDWHGLTNYNAKEFYVPIYESWYKENEKKDLRETIFWKPVIETNEKGEAELSFYNSDENTTFRAIIEGVSYNGNPGRKEYTYSVQLPFSIDHKIPAMAVSEDLITIPIVLKNNSNNTLSGVLKVVHSPALNVISISDSLVEVLPLSTKTFYFSYVVKATSGNSLMTILFNSQRYEDKLSKNIEIQAKGFPLHASLSGIDKEKSMNFEVQHLIKGSLKAKLVVFPNLIEELMSGVESILREPHGCFEQVSSSAYPNIMALQFMEETQDLNPSVRQKALGFIQSGYEKLKAYEIPGGGFEWYGHPPAHEVLSAYGLLQFYEMKKVYDQVDNQLMERTKQFLLERRDGKGNFKISQGKYGFSGTEQSVGNAYIIYALSETGFKDFDKELQKAYEDATTTKDMYKMALVASIMFNLSLKEKANELLAEITEQLNKKGIENMNVKTSITWSYGKSLHIETASFIMLALLKSDKPDLALLQKLSTFISASKTNYGFWGSTQATAMGLKALTEYSYLTRRTEESGTVQVLVNGVVVKELNYEKGRRGKIIIDSLEKYLQEGKQKITVRFLNTEKALPYSLDISANTYLPVGNQDCKIQLSISTNKEKIKTGETVRLTTNIKNKSPQAVPSSVALVGIPAGTSVQLWQLKELMDKKIVDYYEVDKNFIIFYFREMGPKAEINIPLDLKAEIPGNYGSPAGSAYLYYTSEIKEWSQGKNIIIEP